LNGTEEVKEHPWFEGYDWNRLASKQIKSPFMPPPSEDNFDANYTNQEWKDANSEQMILHQQQLQRPSVQKLFQGYYHDETMVGQETTSTKQATTIVATKENPGTAFTDNIQRSSMVSERDNSSGKRASHYQQKASFSSAGGAYSAYHQPSMNKMSSLSQEQQQSTVRGKEFFSRI